MLVQPEQAGDSSLETARRRWQRRQATAVLPARTPEAHIMYAGWLPIRLLPSPLSQPTENSPSAQTYVRRPPIPLPLQPGTCVPASRDG